MRPYLWGEAHNSTRMCLRGKARNSTRTQHQKLGRGRRIPFPAMLNGMVLLIILAASMRVTRNLTVVRWVCLVLSIEHRHVTIFEAWYIKGAQGRRKRMYTLRKRVRRLSVVDKWKVRKCIACILLNMQNISAHRARQVAKEELRRAVARAITTALRCDETHRAPRGGGGAPTPTPTEQAWQPVVHALGNVVPAPADGSCWIWAAARAMGKVVLTNMVPSEADLFLEHDWRCLVAGNLYDASKGDYDRDTSRQFEEAAATAAEKVRYQKGVLYRKGGRQRSASCRLWRPCCRCI